MTDLEALKAARAKISDPARWTQGEFARTKNGRPTDATTISAVCWCARGAVYAVLRPEGRSDFPPELSISSAELFGMHITVVNDTLGHAAVMQMFDHAIAKVEAKAAPC